MRRFLNENEQEFEQEYKDLLQEVEKEKAPNLPNPNTEMFNTNITNTIKNNNNDLESELEKAKSIVDEEYEKVEQKNNPK